MPISIFGALRSDTTMTTNMATYATTGSTFQINAYSQLTFEAGADPTVIAGDSITNEDPNDPTQTMDGNAIAWDYTVNVTDGTNSYEIGLVDYDLDGDGSFDWPTNEQGYFIAFIGSVPPLNTNLTIQSITDNGVSLDVDTVVPCFAENTRIATPNGHAQVQDLQPGDTVCTIDNGAQTIRWIRSRKLDTDALNRNPKSRPIRIAPGALGQGLPNRELRVSPQHRMLINSVIAERMFSQREVFLPAIKLVGLPGITVDEDASHVAYYHILLDQHEVVIAEGAPTESLYLGPQVLKNIGAFAQLELLALCPKMAGAQKSLEFARYVPKKGRYAKQLVLRHLKNQKPLISDDFRSFAGRLTSKRVSSVSEAIRQTHIPKPAWQN